MLFNSSVILCFGGILYENNKKQIVVIGADLCVIYKRISSEDR